MATVVRNSGLIWEKYGRDMRQLEANGRVGPYRWEGAEEKLLPGLLPRLGQRAGNETLIEEMLDRRTSLSGETSFRLFLHTPLFIGSGSPSVAGNGLSWHPTLGAPFIPGSALKQVAYEQAVRVLERPPAAAKDDLISRLFASVPDPGGDLPRGVGALSFLDGLPCAPVELRPDVLTPHYKPYREQASPPWLESQDEVAPGDYFAPVPVPRLTVAPGTAFQFVILHKLGCCTDEERSEAIGWLKTGLMTNGVGATTSRGYGRFVETANREGTAAQ
jgi:CRISPR-associated protein Cmr6